MAPIGIIIQSYEVLSIFILLVSVSSYKSFILFYKNIVSRLHFMVFCYEIFYLIEVDEVGFMC